jgi:Flp pilus assembly pilin Flp
MGKSTMLRRWRVRGAHSRGASAVEYALIVALVAAAMVLVSIALTRAASGAFSATATDVGVPPSDSVSGLVTTSPTAYSPPPSPTTTSATPSTTSATPTSATPTTPTPPASPPPAVTGLTATPGAGQVQLNWAASATATSYTATASPGGSCTVTGTFASCSPLTNDTSYTFTVRAVNSAGTSGPATVSSTPHLHIVRAGNSDTFAPTPPSGGSQLACSVPVGAGTVTPTTPVGGTSFTYTAPISAAPGTNVTVTCQWTNNGGQNKGTTTTVYWIL